MLKLLPFFILIAFSFHTHAADKQVKIQRAEIKKLIDPVTNYLMSAQINPTPQGARVQQVQKKSFFDYIGVQNEDLLIKIDGKLITGARELMEIPNHFMDQNSVKLQINRKGQPLTLTYQIK